MNRLTFSFAFFLLFHRGVVNTEKKVLVGWVEGTSFEGVTMSCSLLSQAPFPAPLPAGLCSQVWLWVTASACTPRQLSTGALAAAWNRQWKSCYSLLKWKAWRLYPCQEWLWQDKDSLVTREASGESGHLPAFLPPINAGLSPGSFLPYFGPQFLLLVGCRGEHPSSGSTWSRMFAKPPTPPASPGREGTCVNKAARSLVLVSSFWRLQPWYWGWGLGAGSVCRGNNAGSVCPAAALTFPFAAPRSAPT